MPLPRIRKFVQPTRQSFNPLSKTPPAGLGVSIGNDQFEEALVVDIIINNDHPLFAVDGYNVGMAQFRFLTSNRFRYNENLNWAFAYDSNKTEYPLKGEIIYVFTALNRFWYLPKFNVSNRITSQDLPELLNETQQSNANISGAGKSQYYKVASSSPIKVGNTAVTNQIGAYFSDLPNVYRLKHLEGDIIYEGRSGQSIRFGTSWLDGVIDDVTKKPFKSIKSDQSPNILIRVGPDPKAKKTANSTFGQVIEDINLDKTSLWMVSDQVVSLKFSTQNSGIHGVSVSDFPNSLSGNQLLINSDRIVMNSKIDKIIGNSAKGIHWTTLQDFTADANKNHTTWTNDTRADRVVNTWRKTIGKTYDISVGSDIIVLGGSNQMFGADKNISLVGSKIFIGSVSSQNEPIVLGETLRNFLDQLITILIQDPIVLVTGSPGSPSPQNPARISELIQLKAQFLSGGTSAQILSLDNFTIRNNDTAKKPRTISPYKEG